LPGPLRRRPRAEQKQSRTEQTRRALFRSIWWKRRFALTCGDNDPRHEEEYRKLGTTAGAYDDWHEGRDPAGITTQDPLLAARLDPVLAGRRLANYLAVLTLECQTIARACGKSHVHNLEPEDLVALTVEAAAMAGVPLAGTDWIPGGVRH
jgi:methylamine---glutamate N-methyltransferase subunit C